MAIALAAGLSSPLNSLLLSIKPELTPLPHPFARVHALAPLLPRARVAFRRVVASHLGTPGSHRDAQEHATEAATSFLASACDLVRHPSSNLPTSIHLAVPPRRR
jgi:hypothetical protein